jgi:DNA end-binding protein Ku
VTVRKQEVAMAASYIETLAGDFEPDEFTDDYRAAVEELVAAKAAGREVTEAPTREPGGGQIIDLVEALRASVRDAKAQRGESGKAASGRTGAAPGKTAKAPAKKSASSAKKSAAKKSAASGTAEKTAAGRGGRKTAAKKTATGRSRARKSA